MQGVIPDERGTDESPLCRRGTMREWSAHAGGNPNVADRSAEQAVAADRFAREIVGFLKASPGALVAAELFRSAASITTCAIIDPFSLGFANRCAHSRAGL